MKKIIAFVAIIIVVILAVSSIGGCSVCSNQGMHGKFFKDDGTAKPDTTLTEEDTFKIISPTRIQLFMESSGSMNGFLRSGVPTAFKTDLWEIASYYRSLISAVNVISTDGGTTKGAAMSVEQFQTPLNSGGFVSAKSTNLCQMIRSVVDGINVRQGEVAVFVSDMEYDPVGANAPNALQSEYPTDIAKILSDFGYSAALVAATSNSVDVNGNSLTNKRPYYYLILGGQECVASVRNDISAMLDEHKHLVDNIETGFNYGNVDYTIGDYSGCTQIGDAASFKAVKNTGCTIRLDIKLENYRWLLSTDKAILEKSLDIKSMSGTKIKVDSIAYDVKNVVDKELKRDATARIYISIGTMSTDCDVITWNIKVPATDTSKMQQLFTDTPNSLEQTYSISEFIVGMFRASLVCRDGKDNYMHISKN